MKFFYFLLVLVTLVGSIYALFSLNYRSFLVSTINLISILFLITKKSPNKYYLFYIIFGIVSSELLIFVYHLISNTDLKELGTLFKDNFDLSESIYELKGSSIFGLDFNSIASFFAVISLIFKQYDKKLLSILFFILCILTFSRSVIFFAFLFLIIPTKKINMQIFIPIILTALVFFINYQGNINSIIIKKNTYFLFFDVLLNTPSELIFGEPGITFKILNNLVLGDVNIGHTLPGTVVSFGLIQVLPSFGILFLLWIKDKLIRLPILFLITYGLFSVLILNINTPALILASYANQKVRDLKND